LAIPFRASPTRLGTEGKRTLAAGHTSDDMVPGGGFEPTCGLGCGAVCRRGRGRAVPKAKVLPRNTCKIIG
jgi:hypothetical protein